ncbi:TetR/AcrR family transcriptional regulator [Paenibacillus thermotolerans]|uniref:TetR/AcrR family transcriptional regulator n=1 Tax=Paenibacillus thermotolerans TaxID=3027807 RepID=UPI0023686F37|nr:MULTISPECIES: TetR/AcrR family transcriptional regulator [unclassified Paenibacillus]
MVRIVKPPEERRAEILESAKQLFSTKGYENTSVNDIIHKIGVAKGTFYHYFKSKEEIADAVIQDAVERSIEAFKKINSNAEIKSIEKYSNIIRFFSQEAAKHYDAGLMKHLHHEDNVRLHKKMKVAMIEEFVPIITDVIVQGVNEGVFHTEYPREVSEFLLVGMHFIFDPSYFACSKEQFVAKLDALCEIHEKLLEAPKGSFLFIKEVLINLYL